MMNFNMKEAKKAFRWALNEMDRLKCPSEPITVTFESDNMFTDKDGCIVSVFYDYEIEKALIRYDWLGDGSLRYNILTNYEEILRIAPRSTEHMLENGIKIYHFFDGPNGGVTKKTNKKWV